MKKPGNKKQAKNKPKNPNKAAGIIMLVCGTYVFALASGLAPKESIHSPMPIIWLAGFIFFAGGSLALLQEQKQKQAFWREIMAVLILTAMGVIGLWVAIYGADQVTQKGLPVSTPENNKLMARIIFGIGSLITWSMAIWATKRAVKIWKKNNTN